MKINLCLDFFFSTKSNFDRSSQLQFFTYVSVHMNLRDRQYFRRKKRQVGNKSDLSSYVALPVQISNLFLSDLKQLASLAV